MKLCHEPSQALLLNALGIKPGTAFVAVEEDAPDEVSEAVHEIAGKTQHGYIHTWLSDLLEKDIRPKVRNKEDEARIDQILAYRDHCVSLVSPDGEPSVPHDRCVEEKLSRIRRKYADNLLQYQIYQERTEKVRGIFKVALLATVAGFFLSQFAPGIVQTVEALGDDVANWFAQVMTMKNQGLTKKEFVKSQAFPAAGVAGVELLTNNMNGVLKSGTANRSILGFQYGLAASLLSLAGIPAGIYVQAKNYLALVKEGKVDPPHYAGKFKKVRLYLHAVKEAAKESLKHPAVTGIALGSLAAIAAGALLGPLSVPFAAGCMLQNPVFLAVTGAGPSIGALLTSKLHHRYWNHKMEKVLEKIAVEEEETTMCTAPCISP